MSRRTKGLLIIILFITSFIPILLIFHVNAAKTRRTPAAPLQYDQAEDWVSVWDTLENDTGHAIHVDPFDNIYLAGSAAHDTVVVKYDSSGRQQWNTTWGGHSVDTPSGILADDQGVYVVGSTSSFGAGGNDAYLLRLNSDGSVGWSRYWGGVDNDEGRGIAQGNDDLVYICGMTEDSLSSSRDMFVASFDIAGTKTWDAIWGDENNEEAFDVAVGGNVTIYLAGMRYEENQSEANVAFVGLGLSGEEIFSNEWGGPGFDVGYAIDFALDEKIVLAGYSESSPFVFLEYEANGTLSQTRFHEFYDEGPKEYWAYDIIVSPYGSSLHIVGMTEMGSFILGTSTYSTGYSLGPAGFAEECRGATLDSSNNLYCIGTNRLEFSTDFIAVQAYTGPFDDEEQYHELDLIWRYNSDGVITPLDYANFDEDPEKEVICRLYTIESEWLEVIGEGNRTWAFVPGGDATDLYGIPTNLDRDELSEVLVYYSHQENSNKSIIALDSDGLLLWSWQGNMTSNRPYAQDMDNDLIDEIAVGIDGGIQLWNASSTVLWEVESESSQLANIHAFGDYDLDDRYDLVTSLTNITSFQKSSECIVFDLYGTQLVEFPLLSMELGHEPINEGMPVVLDMGRLNEGVGFLYATSLNGGNTSLFLVGPSGEDIIWASPWNPAINRSWFEANKTQLADMNNDGLDEVVFTGAFGTICLMDTTGRIVWLTQVSGGFLTRPFGPLEDALVDFDGNGLPELMIGGWEMSAIDPDTGHRLYQSSHWYFEGADFVVNLDDDSKYELVVHDVYVLEVFHYAGIWQEPYYPQDGGWALIVMGMASGVFVAVAVWYWKSGRSTAG
ncbi:MAG: FG-GAP repeat domain-containing protein [Candidatus Thorarchaeota archaeon]